MPVDLISKIFSLEKAFIIEEKRFIIAKTYQIDEEKKLNILYLQGFNLAPKMGHPHSVTRSSIAIARYRKIAVSFTTK